MGCGSVRFGSWVDYERFQGMLSANLKMEAPGFYETLVALYQITQFHVLQDSNIQLVTLLCDPFSQNRILVPH